MPFDKGPRWLGITVCKGCSRDGLWLDDKRRVGARVWRGEQFKVSFAPYAFNKWNLGSTGSCCLSLLQELGYLVLGHRRGHRVKELTTFSEAANQQGSSEDPLCSTWVLEQLGCSVEVRTWCSSNMRSVLVVARGLGQLPSTCVL